MDILEKSLETFRRFLEEGDEDEIKSLFEEVNRNSDGGMPAKDYFAFVELQLDVNVLFGFNSQSETTIMN